MDNVIDPSELAEWRKAGKIAKTALLYGAKMVKPGVKLIDVTDAIEEKIRKLGGEPAFPAQVSLNHIAAHYCPEPDDPLVFKDEVVCLDCGVHVNGAIGDNAVSVDLSGKHAELLKASKEALKNAIKTLGIGVKTSEVGRVINETITSYGYRPVKNLSGHGIGRYKIHTHPSMPNYDDHTNITLKENMIVAIEPFATDGRGLIHEAEECQVFMQVSTKKPRSQFAREVLTAIQTYNGLPFTTRWLTRPLGSVGKVRFGLKELIKENIIHGYPPLVENAKGMVAQFENTMYIGKKIEVLTKADDE